MTSPWKPFGLFCFLSLLLLALVPVLSAVLGVSMDFGAIASRASAETGIKWTSNLWNVLRLAWVEPGLWLLILGSSVPTLAAIVTLALVRDRAAWRDWLSRFSPIGPDPLDRDTWGVVQDVALMVIGLLVAQLVVFELRNWIEPGMYVRDPALFGVGLVSSILFAVLLDQGAVLEEGGWRGYATPLLQNRNVSPLKVAILIGTVWGLWHVPRDVVTGVIERLGMFEYLALFLPSFVFGTITMSVIASYFMNRLGGSVWPAIIVHGLGNDAMGFSGLVTIEQALTPYHQITKAIPFALVALLIVAASGRRLGRP